jgi:hypothetical protein
MSSEHDFLTLYVLRGSARIIFELKEFSRSFAPRSTAEYSFQFAPTKVLKRRRFFAFAVACV